MEFHEVCSMFPLIEGEEFQALVSDIKNNGLIESIWTYQGKIIDGRNRYRACQESGVEPRYREWTNDVGSLAQFVLSQNLHRRHLTAGQRSAIALTIKPLIANNDMGAHSHQVPNGKRAPKSSELAGKVVGVSGTSVAVAERVLKNAPDVFDALRVGNVTLRQAEKLSSLPESLRTEFIAKGLKVEDKVEQIVRAQNKDFKKFKLRNPVEIDLYAEGQGILTGDIDLLWDALPDNSVDLFFTDPPYERKDLYCYEKLAKLAQAKLKPHSLLIAYCGNIVLLEALDMLRPHLDWFWLFAVEHEDSNASYRNHHTFSKFKPLLVFTKRPITYPILTNWTMDMVKGGGRSKEYHPHGQSVDEALYFIKTHCPEGGLVVDPFMGGGTTAVAAKLLVRRWLGTEIDPHWAAVSRKRIQETIVS